MSTNVEDRRNNPLFITQGADTNDLKYSSEPMKGKSVTEGKAPYDLKNGVYEYTMVNPFFENGLKAYIPDPQPRQSVKEKKTIGTLPPTDMPFDGDILRNIDIMLKIPGRLAPKKDGSVFPKKEKIPEKMEKVPVPKPKPKSRLFDD